MTRGADGEYQQATQLNPGEIVALADWGRFFAKNFRISLHKTSSKRLGLAIVGVEELADGLLELGVAFALRRPRYAPRCCSKTSSMRKRGSENHPELWLKFAHALGLTRDEVLAAERLPAAKY